MSLTLLAFGFVAICLLTAISAFFSSSELAVFAIARHRVDMIVASEVPGAGALGKLRDNPHRFLITVLVSNNVANIAAASVATAVLINFLPPGQAATGATIGTSFFVIAFGEIAPKSYAVVNAERHALRVASPIVVIQRILTPILILFELTTGLTNRLTGGEQRFESYLTRDEIETIVLSGETSGVLNEEEGAMIRRVLDLERTTVRNVIVPRVAMTMSSADASVDEMIDLCSENHVTRLPLYGENRDDIIGVIDVKDLLRIKKTGGSLQEMLQPATFVPASKPLDEILTEMQLQEYRMAFVVDEFGTVLGLATFEDVIEEIVGEFFEGGDTDPLQVVDENTAFASGWATVDYVNERLALSLADDGPYETIAGLVNHHLGRLAEEGDRVELETAVITVLDATERRVRRVRINWARET